jgi:Ser/Thr protein kinase RdoA (MazF antagonist)
MLNTLDIAKEALSCYSIRCQSLELIGQNANTIYKVIDKENNCYSLRIHLSKSEALESFWTEQHVINSEMVWLDSLTNDTDIVLPSPIKNNLGEYITEIANINCTVVKWVEGEQKPFVPTVKDAEYVGEMIGKLHKQSSFWEVPAFFTRPSFDGSRISQSLEKLEPLANAGEFKKNEMAIIREAGQLAIMMMNVIERTPNNWGMIHADLIPSNFVFFEQEARPIDFGACGFGYYLFDLGWTFSYIHPKFRSQLLEAYSKHFTLPHNYVEQLEGFFVAGQLETLNFWLGLPESNEWLPSHISKLASREFMHYVNKEQFLFNGTPYWE